MSDVVKKGKRRKKTMNWCGWFINRKTIRHPHENLNWIILNMNIYKQQQSSEKKKLTTMRIKCEFMKCKVHANLMWQRRIKKRNRNQIKCRQIVIKYLVLRSHKSSIWLNNGSCISHFYFYSHMSYASISFYCRLIFGYNKIHSTHL